MAIGVRSCLGRLLILAILAGVGVAVWWNYPELLDRVRGLREADTAPSAVPSPELADATLDRFEAFRAGTQGTEMRLGDAELSSLVRYSLPGVIPPGVQEAEVRVRDGQIHLGARVAMSSLPDIPALREVVGLLPDTVPVEIRGTLAPFDDERAALHVDRIEASRIPLPARYIPEILTALGRTHAQNLPSDALLVPLPRGLEAAYVLRDSLVLVANP
jgi:hypothetical protein